MSDWAAKRFWQDVGVARCADGFEVLLDGRRLRTPIKTALTVPTQALAEAIAQEWAAQEDQIDPLSMPVTRAANATLDKVMPQRAEVAAHLADYGGSDLICYRASHPEGLVAAQAKAWDPLVDWAATRLQAPLQITSGVMPVAQDAAVLHRLADRVGALDPFALTAFSDLVSLSGSLVIGFAAIEGAFPLDQLWEASRIDEAYQIAEWGEDDEATARTAQRSAAFFAADRFYRLSRTA